MIITIVVFLLILSVLVLIHEAGHFFTAKKFGIKVEEFGFGFPPRIWGKKIGETLYSINLLPIGGFVKLYGEDEAGAGKVGLPEGEKVAKDLDRAFFARPPWQKFVVVFAGVFMNFLLSVVIVSYVFGVQGVPTPSDKVTITEIAPGSPAKTSGLKVGETIFSINGINIKSTDQILSITKKNLGKDLTLVVGKNSSSVRQVSLTPRKSYPKNQGPMGIAIGQSVTIKKYPWYEAPFVGTREVAKDSLLIVGGLGSIVKDLSTNHEVPAGVTGPVGIAQLTGQFVQNGPVAVLSFMAILSLNLAVLNILPIPALDGGRLFFILIEWVTRRKVNPKFEAYAHAVGIALLLALIAIITLHDFVRIFEGKPILPQ